MIFKLKLSRFIVFIQKPPRVGSVKVYTENVSNKEIMLDIEILYVISY